MVNVFETDIMPQSSTLKSITCFGVFLYLKISLEKIYDFGAIKNHLSFDRWF